MGRVNLNIFIPHVPESLFKSIIHSNLHDIKAPQAIAELAGSPYDRLILFHFLIVESLDICAAIANQHSCRPTQIEKKILQVEKKISRRLLGK